MSLRLIFLFFIPVVFYGCIGAHPFSPPGGERGKGYDYIPKDTSRESEALYHFGKARLLALEGSLDEAVDDLSRAIELDPEDSFLRESLVRLYLELEHNELAVQTALELLERDPENIEMRMLLGDLYFNLQEDGKAIEQYRRVLELDPGQETAYLHLALALARTGDSGAAIETARDLQKRNPQSLEARLILGRLYRETGLDGLAEEIYLEILRDNPGLEPAYLELGGIYEKRQETPKAIAVYEAALLEHPRDVGLRHHLARLHILQNDLDRAEAQLKEILAISPDDLEALRKRGLIFMEQKRWEEAVGVFSDILDRNPQADTVRFYLGTSLEGLEDWEGALDAFRAVASGSHRDLHADALTHMSFLHQRLGQIDAAISAMERLLQNHRGRPEHYSYLAALFEEKKEYGQALLIVERGMERFPEDTELIYHRGLILEKSGDRQGAQKVMRRVLQANPDHAEALNFLAYAYAEKDENLQEALRMALRALTLKSEPHIRDTLGWVYYKLDRFEEARVEIEKASEDLPEDPVVLEHLGDVYLSLGLHEKARAAYGRALEIDADNERLQRKSEEAVADGHVK